MQPLDKKETTLIEKQKQLYVDFVRKIKHRFFN